MLLYRPRYLFTGFLILQCAILFASYAFLLPVVPMLEAATASLLGAIPMYFAERLVSR